MNNTTREMLKIYLAEAVPLSTWEGWSSWGSRVEQFLEKVFGKDAATEFRLLSAHELFDTFGMQRGHIEGLLALADGVPPSPEMVLSGTGSVKVEPVFWKPGMFRLFISHLASQGKFAGDLQEALSEYGITSFVAHKDIVPTTEWQEQIELGLATCDSLVALLHPGFHSSKWTDQEIGFVMGRKLPITAVRFGEDPYGFIGRFQAFSGFSKEPHMLAEELFNAYRKNKQSQRRMGESLINLFTLSGSFAMATRRLGYLEELGAWNEDFSTKLATALQCNSQIAGAWGVPNRIQNLLLKWKT